MPDAVDAPHWLAHAARVHMKPRQADAVFAKLGRALAAVFARSDGTLILSRHAEVDSPGEFVASFGGDRLRALASHEHLLDAVVAVVEADKVKTCLVCKRELPLRLFSHDRTRPSGRLNRCRRCEAQRVKAYGEKKRTKRAKRDGLVVLPFAGVAPTGTDAPQVASGSPSALDTAAAK